MGAGVVRQAHHEPRGEHHEREPCTAAPERALPYSDAMNLLEEPGRFYWKWLAVAAVLLVIYAIERFVRTGGLF